MSTQSQMLHTILSRLHTLPEIPSVALKVNNMLDEPDVDVQDLADVIMMDPALTAQVLKLCNSAEYGFARKIATISEAVSILGYQTLKRVIFTLISHSCLNRPMAGYALEKGDLWENALTCGVFTRHIAQKLNFRDPELAFVAALLRDIGKMILEQYLVGKAFQVEHSALNQKQAFNDAEETVIGVSHTLIGYEVARQWNFPEPLLNVIQYHHQPTKLPQSLTTDDKMLVSIVHLADVYAMMLGAGIGFDGLMYPLDPAIFDYINLKNNAVTLEKLYTELFDLQDTIHTMTTALAH